MDSIFHPTAIAFIFFLIMLIAGSCIQWPFLIKLKKHHPLQWEHAGSPTIMNNGDLTKAWSTTKYLLDRRYEESEIIEGIEFCELFRLPMLIGYFFSASTIPICFISLLNFGWPAGWE
jgi:hypothetical protein